MTYPKRLIEVDLPIKRISAHARKEKDVKRGHIWNLHIWWARRPLTACRAVMCAALWPDPADEHCPQVFRDKAAKLISGFAAKASSDLSLAGTCSEESQKRWIALSKSSLDPKKSAHLNFLRFALLDFITDFSTWDNSSVRQYIDTARDITRAAHESLGNPGGVKSIVVDTFAGNGAIPAEALRLDCESIAMDLNPVAVLFLRILLSAAPKHGERLLEEFSKAATYIQTELSARVSKYYPKNNGKTPIAWLWARTVTCEGPACGATVPLISQTLIAKGTKKVWIEITGNKRDKTVGIHIHKGASVPHSLLKTAGGGAATCPVCGHTTPKGSVKHQGMEGKIGHRLYGIAVAIGHRQGKDYFDADEKDVKAFEAATRVWEDLITKERTKEIVERFPLTYGLHVPPHYGIKTWGDLFSPRQKLALHTLGEVLGDYKVQLEKRIKDQSLVRDIITALALAASNGVHYNTNMSAWLAEHVVSCFITGNAIAMRWDWCEANPLVPEYAGGIGYVLDGAKDALEAAISINSKSATVNRGNATSVALPDDSVDFFFTDPPYYDVVPYADLSDVCYVWLKRYLKNVQPDLFTENLTPKAEQIVVNPYTVEDGRGEQTSERYRVRMTEAFKEGRRILKPDGIGTIVFAHKGTEAWETLLKAIIDAGFVVTASWPIDTERGARMRASKSAALQSSIHLVVRPRENPDGTLREDEVGEWRDTLQELPKRIQDWMPRLAGEGVVGADAIFACLGPALEIFSRYSRVEKASGEQVTLREYLEHVWAAVAEEALKMIFEGADAKGFEEDSRLTAMWLWTLSTGNGSANGKTTGEDDEDENKKAAVSGYTLEYDAARKIAQGLGADLETLTSVEEVKGDKAFLLPVVARTRHLFGKEEQQSPRQRAKKERQLNLLVSLQEVQEEADGWGEKTTPPAGSTVLDRVHQAMILFAANRGAALKRFLVEDDIGKDHRCWKLAQALSPLYPKDSDEKRWVDGVLGRKKSLGF